MAASTCDRFHAETRKRARTAAGHGTLHGTLLWAALTVLMALGAFLTLDRAPVALPPAVETGASAGQA